MHPVRPGRGRVVLPYSDGGDDDGDGDGDKAAGSSSQAGPSSPNQAWGHAAFEPFLPLRASPDSEGPLFTRTPAPTSPAVNPYNSYS